MTEELRGTFAARRARAVAAGRKAHRPASTARRGESSVADRHSSREPVPCRRGDGAGGLRQVDAARRVGRGRGSAGCVGVARPLRRRSRGVVVGAGVGVRTDLAGRFAAERGCRRPRCLGAWAAPRRAWRLRSRRVPIRSCSCSTTCTRCSRPAVTTCLGVVMSGMPHDSQLVAASRAEQPHLPRSAGGR